MSESIFLVVGSTTLPPGSPRIHTATAGRGVKGFLQSPHHIIDDSHHDDISKDFNELMKLNELDDPTTITKHTKYFLLTVETTLKLWLVV